MKMLGWELIRPLLPLQAHGHASEEGCLLASARAWKWHRR